VARLRDQWDDRDTGVTTNDCDVLVGWVGVLDLGDKAGGTDNIESSDAEEALGIVDAFALVDLSADGDSGVDLENISLV
jgi:hypothetical protein